MFNNKLMNVDVAIEIISEMIGDNLLAIKKAKDENIIKELNRKNELYTRQRDEIYSGNEETIKFVIEVYGSKLKSQR